MDLLSDQDLQDLGITTRYLLDDEGRPIPEVIHHEPPVAAVLAFLAANYPKEYGNKIEVNNRSTAASGVQVVPRLKPAPAIEAPAEPPIDVEPDDLDLAEILGPEDESAPATIEIEVTSAPEAAVVEPVAEAIPATELAPSPSPAEPAKPLSTLQRDLMARLATRSSGAKPAAPMVSAGRIEADDIDPRRIGAGTSPRGATKIV